jgi:hypothetical protein
MMGSYLPRTVFLFSDFGFLVPSCCSANLGPLRALALAGLEVVGRSTCVALPVQVCSGGADTVDHLAAHLSRHECATLHYIHLPVSHGSHFRLASLMTCMPFLRGMPMS